jgi:hypothetical protein
MFFVAQAGRGPSVAAVSYPASHKGVATESLATEHRKGTWDRTRVPPGP